MTLADAQLVVARESGFGSWTQLLCAARSPVRADGVVAAVASMAVPNIPPTDTDQEMTVTTVSTSASSNQLDLHQLLEVLTALERGDLSKRLPPNLAGVSGEIAKVLNKHLDQMSAFTQEQFRVGNEIAFGKFGGQMDVPELWGAWRSARDAVNHAGGVICSQIRSLTSALQGLADGNFASEFTFPCTGEMQELRDKYNTMLAELRLIKSQSEQLCYEMSTSGRLGRAMNVPNAKGQWRELVDDLSRVSHNITSWFRNFSAVIHAFEKGEFNWRPVVEVQGEIDELKQTLIRISERMNKPGTPVRVMG